jgi:hypothetical protein
MRTIHTQGGVVVENPETWGPAEKIIHGVITDSVFTHVGLSMPRRIADALRGAGLLLDDDDLTEVAEKISQSPEFQRSRDAAEHARAEGRVTPLDEAIAKLEDLDREAELPPAPPLVLDVVPPPARAVSTGTGRHVLLAVRETNHIQERARMGVWVIPALFIAWGCFFVSFRKARRNQAMWLSAAMLFMFTACGLAVYGVTAH